MYLMQMGGNFPTLGASTGIGKKPSPQVGSVNAWGQPQSKNNTSSAMNSGAVSKSGVEKSTWERGNKAPEIAVKNNSSAWSTAATRPHCAPSGATSDTSGKKEKKTKIVLMSNK